MSNYADVRDFLATPSLIPFGLAALSFLLLYVKFTNKNAKGSYAKLPSVPGMYIRSLHAD